MGGAASPFEGRGGRARFGREVLVRLPQEDVENSFEEEQPLHARGEAAGPTCSLLVSVPVSLGNREGSRVVVSDVSLPSFLGS
ncbi:hypothetical protein H633G_11405 [Metarhizium anisopliae BRIP 53284]|nr:hypothetical protein H633G_11405 [Metarhizium anisopliae BRIP 53284]